ncbi:hypothetical protein J1N35_021098 [Gossypium stocksii]|uniref:Uncharacterized protein n=1 Tax=Gossypium stocksii TaxID=47602 RepID=A0A9D4A1I5_9ROSI|nr:hypothetical protein J1N35_021098 [Gossypium stocksii]
MRVLAITSVNEWPNIVTTGLATASFYYEVKSCLLAVARALNHLRLRYLVEAAHRSISVFSLSRFLRLAFSPFASNPTSPSSLFSK